MRSLKIMIPALLIATLLPGCSRIRQMTRRDYASMEDPFTNRLRDDDTVASRDAGQFRTAGQTQENSAGGAGLFAGSMPAKTDSSGTATTGPSLSDFVQKTDKEVTKARQTVAAFGDSVGAEGKTDMVGLTEFLGEQAQASGLTETAQQLDVDFAQWAATQKQEWANSAAAVDEKASPFLDVANAARQSFSQPSSAGNAAFGGNPTRPTRNTQDSEIATPFIQQASGQRNAAEPNRVSPAGFTVPSGPRIQPRPPVGTQNPFDEMIRSERPAESGFDRNGIGQNSRANSSMSGAAEWDIVPVEPHQSPATDPFIQPGVASTNRSLDSDFSFDSGWKPSGLVAE